MNACSRCGNLLVKDALFCPICKLQSSLQKRTTTTSSLPLKKATSIGNTYGGKFCSPDESQIVTIGTGYIANFLSGGEIEKAGATLTNKRVYFSGNVFSFTDKGHLTSMKEQKIVNVRDVTGTGYKQFNPIQYIIWAVIALISGIVVYSTPMDNLGVWIGGITFAVLIVVFFIRRKTLLTIEYAGGNIGFDVRWLQKKEQDVFIRNIHLAKDKLYSMTAVEQGFTVDSRESDEIPDL